MSDADSFIDEVTEEVRRDRLFATLRKWAWLAILIVLLVVGGTAYREWRIASAEAQAQEFGDSILSALDQDDPAARIEALTGIEAPTPGGEAVLGMLTAAEEASAGDQGEASARLQSVADRNEVPSIYRQIASFKALTRDDALPAEERRAGLEALAVPGQPLRLLAEEQLALIDIEVGERPAALERLQRIVEDSEATEGLRRRASQLIVALGGEPPAN